MPLSATNSSTGSKKRRRSNEARVTKFYAVRTGVRPGIYGTWKECYEQIDKFKGARYKAFTNHKDAQDFVAGNNIEIKDCSMQREKYYGVVVGHRPGVYTDWTEVGLQIKGIKRPKVKKFRTLAEAEFFVMTKGNELGKASEYKEQMKDKVEAEHEIEDEQKKQKLAVEVGEKEKQEPIRRKIRSSDVTQSSRYKDPDKNIIQVYTDGSARRNGQKGARAGVGVFFGTNDARNLSEPLQGELQTNQRAELTAVLRALEICDIDKNVQIFTDSTYSINCLTNWYKNWLKNRWKTSNGSSVVNKDLIQAVRLLMDRRSTFGSKTDLIWVRGHDHDFGNEAADRLAVAGATATI